MAMNEHDRAPQPGDTSDDTSMALIHLHVRGTLKGDWVKKSRAAGQKLTDWIVERVAYAEAQTTHESSATPHAPEDQKQESNK